MAVLSRPAPGHVRAPGEAIAIVDLDEDRAVRTRRRGGGVPAVTGVVAAGVIALALIAGQQATPQRSAPGVTLATADPVVAASARPSTAALAPVPGLGFAWFGYIDAPHELALPSGVTGVQLFAMPASLLNDQPAARFRVPLAVRGTTGVGATDSPVVIAWSEDGIWYELSSTRLTIPQLIELAGALR